MSRYVIISLILAVFLTRSGDFAPAKYDQRQDGKYNVHAKLENFLIVVATSGSNDGGLLSDLAAQALDFKNLASRAVAAKAEEAEREDEPLREDRGEQTSIVQEGDKEPYRVEIVRVQKDESHQLENQKGKVNVPASKEEVVKTLKDVSVSVSGGTGERKKEEILPSLKHLSEVGKIEEPHLKNKETPEHAIVNQGTEKSESTKAQAPVVRTIEHSIPSSHDTHHPEPVKTGKVEPKIQGSQEGVIHTMILDGSLEGSVHQSDIMKIVIKAEPAVASIPDKIPQEKIDGAQIQQEIKAAQSLADSRPAILPEGVVKRSVANHKILVGGTSVKKELSGVKAATLADKSEDDLQENRPEEYKLLTDGVHGLENCGPAGYRDNHDLMCKIKKHSDDRN